VACLNRRQRLADVQQHHLLPCPDVELAHWVSNLLLLLVLQIEFSIFLWV
jgi:hypothetical protein